MSKSLLVMSLKVAGWGLFLCVMCTFLLSQGEQKACGLYRYSTTQLHALSNCENAALSSLGWERDGKQTFPVKDDSEIHTYHQLMTDTREIMGLRPTSLPNSKK